MNTPKFIGGPLDGQRANGWQIHASRITLARGVYHLHKTVWCADPTDTDRDAFVWRADDDKLRETLKEISARA